MRRRGKQQQTPPEIQGVHVPQLQQQHIQQQQQPQHPDGAPTAPVTEKDKENEGCRQRSTSTSGRHKLYGAGVVSIKLPLTATAGKTGGPHQEVNNCRHIRS
eukprot:GHVU01017901.1.p1 GENE.GHVU01017901.1~~GHVU01017901.1.p1  ORF type:complete len:102 (+),score=18.73 GHVU01017901.1:991-1296(+)